LEWCLSQGLGRRKAGGRLSPPLCGLRTKLNSPLVAKVLEAMLVPGGRAEPITMEHGQCDDCDALAAEPFIGRNQHALHQALAAPGFVEKGMINVTLRARKIALTIASEVNP